MTMMLFAEPRRATPPRYPQKRKCQIFQWIGQSFDHCEFCGRPEQEHLYHPPYGSERPIFYVKQWKDWGEKGWYWQPVGSLVGRRQSVKPKKRKKK